MCVPYVILQNNNSSFLLKFIGVLMWYKLEPYKKLSINGVVLHKSYLWALYTLSLYKKDNNIY